MRISFFFNRAKGLPPKPAYISEFEKAIPELMQKSGEAMREISAEHFASDTFRTLFRPEFKPKKPNTLMAISTTTPNKPVEVAYEICQEDHGFVKINIFAQNPEHTLLGEKIYLIDTDANGKLVMKSGDMYSYEDACNMVGVKGIGMLGRMLQIKDAMEKGINKIPCLSRARATLFHLKTGFTPVQELEKIDSLSGLDKAMEKVKMSADDTYSRNFTPIIVSKDGEYYLDKNSTLCLAYLRQIKENYAKGLGDGVRPFIRGWIVDLELAGKNYDVWAQNIEKMF